MRILQLRRGRLLKGLLAAAAAAGVLLLLASHVSSPSGASFRSAGALVVSGHNGIGCAWPRRLFLSLCSPPPLQYVSAASEENSYL